MENRAWSIISLRGYNVGKFQLSRSRLKIGFGVLALVLLVGLPLLAPTIGIGGGQIVSSRTQVLYAVLSFEIVLAVYIWGVGNWSRFEPPPTPSGSTTPQTSNPAQGQQRGTAGPAQKGVPPAAQPPGTPPRQQGGH